MFNIGLYKCQGIDWVCPPPVFVNLNPAPPRSCGEGVGRENRVGRLSRSCAKTQPKVWFSANSQMDYPTLLGAENFVLQRGRRAGFRLRTLEPSFSQAGESGACRIFSCRVCGGSGTHPTKGKASDSFRDLEHWFRQEVATRWPAALGSLSLRRNSCMRQRCHACATGEQHPS